MDNDNKHIILIGFKHVGKSVIGRELAVRLQKPFVDLDQKVESAFLDIYHEKLTCRQIMQKHGQLFFRELERLCLKQIMGSSSSIISLGGGTPIEEENQTLLKHHVLIHITAPRGIVFERIMLQGRPAYFSTEEDPFSSFNRLWNEREKIYLKMTTLSIENNNSIELAVNTIIKKMNNPRLELQIFDS